MTNTVSTPTGSGASATPYFPGTASPLYIDGRTAPSEGGTYPVLSPSTGETIGSAADASDAEVDAAVAAACRVFDTTEWSRDPALRARCLRALRDRLGERLEEIRALTIAEVGAGDFLTRGPQLEGPIEGLGYFADLAENFAWREDLGTLDVMGIASRREVRHEAAGVVAAITPWNFPHQINLAKVGPALAAGCTVVLKAAPDTPWCAAVLGVAAEEAGFPPGVFNVLTSSRNEVGAQLVEHPDVDLVSFTGSTATGKAIMTAAAGSLKKVFLELGGKSASIVLDDADLGLACMMTAINATMHAGQGCALTTRLLVPRERLAEAIDLARGTLEGIGCGDPADPGTMCGPLVSARQRDHVASYVELARSEGGVVECGGGAPEHAPAGKEGGFWFEPTLVSGLTPESRVAREEIFGPVLVVLPHDGDDDAIRIANDSPYGLSGAVFGTDPARIEHVVDSVRTGTLGVNGAQWYGVDVPFGGYKQSGIGREMGVAGFTEYLETKAVGTPA